ncbi:MAG: DUF2269 domain-containing protein [Gammaproteobacteria bacterium]|nr:DUF2269 domain-containing protein [Gammaproteobacteria bacterium]MDH5800420.1 DUF2269 domain-containing protein [Gammaproteobacteria bacterium]
MTYLSLKAIHLLSMVLLFGTGLGSAWYKWMADRSGNVHHIAETNRCVVIADWVFTTPTVILQPLTGMGMVMLMDLPLNTPWVLWSLVLYMIAGACWLPVVWLQIKMKRLALLSRNNNTSLPDQYWVYARWWFYLGVPAFTAMVLIVCLMVFKVNG